MDAQVLQAGEGRVIAMGPIKVIVQEDGSRTRDTFAMAEFTLPPHAPSPPPHIHHAHEEGFYVLDGEIEFKVDGETVHANKGAFVMVPIGVAHTFSNPGNTPARFLNTFTPPKYIHYFEEMSEFVARGGMPTPEQQREIMARYDTEVVRG